MAFLFRWSADDDTNHKCRLLRAQYRLLHRVRFEYKPGFVDDSAVSTSFFRLDISKSLTQHFPSGAVHFLGQR